MRHNTGHPKKPTAICRREETIKKSVFIAITGPADTPAEAMAFIQQHGDACATHNCWAYKIGQQYRFNDDGEPGGTAGKPILAAIEGQGFDHCVALAIRYYGGIKLGTGGLIRAYGGVIARALQKMPFERLVPQTQIQLCVPFAHAQAIHNLVNRYQATLTEEAYENNGVRLFLQLPTEKSQEFIDKAVNLTRGKVRITSHLPA